MIDINDSHLNHYVNTNLTLKFIYLFKTPISKFNFDYVLIEIFKHINIGQLEGFISIKNA